MVWQMAAMPETAKVDLEMAMGVPGQRADAVLGLDAERLQHTRQLARAAVRIAIGIAVGAPDRQAGNDLGIAVVLRGVLQQRGNHQRPVHHQALHVSVLLSVVLVETPD
jgi:hypothetical protein